MYPCVGEDVAFVASVWLSTESLGSFNKVVQAALSLGQIGALALLYAMRDPVDDQCLGALIPHRIVNRIACGVDDIQALPGGILFSLHDQLRCSVVLLADGRKLKNILARHRESRSCIGGSGVRKDDPAWSGGLGPAYVLSGCRHQPVSFTGKIGLAAEYDRAVYASLDGRRKQRHCAAAVHLPLRDPCGVRAIGGDLQTQLFGLDLIEGGAVETVWIEPKPFRIRDRHKLRAVPIGCPQVTP